VINKRSCATIALVASFSSVASAETLVIEPTSEELVATSVDYRVDATRRLYNYGAYAMFRDLRGEEAVEAVKDPEHSMFWYRFLSAFRRCEEYDLLQGASLFDNDSWYLAAWYRQAELTPIDGDYQAVIALTDEERACGGKRLPESSVHVLWTDPTDATVQIPGMIQAVAQKGAPSIAEVTCELVGSPGAYEGLSCDTATLSLTARKTTIIVHLKGAE